MGAPSRRRPALSDAHHGASSPLRGPAPDPFSLPFGVVGKTVLVALLLSLLFSVSLLATCFSRQTLAEEDKAPVPGLPAYITREMVAQALLCQERYGHPAGATIAQIILESGSGDELSRLATQAHNLFGMKWASSFDKEPEVVGSSSWQTNEEVDGASVEVLDGFTVFGSDVECIEFRSRVFLQGSIYANNESLRQAMDDRDSESFARALQEAGWATDSAYADKLIALIDQYNLRRFDAMSAQDFIDEMDALDAGRG